MRSHSSKARTIPQTVRGATGLEYGALAALLAAVAMGSVASYGREIEEAFVDASAGLQEPTSAPPIIIQDQPVSERAFLSFSAAGYSLADREPFTTADFSNASSPIRFDPTVIRWQSPGGGAPKGYYETSEVIGSRHDDVFAFEDLQPGQTYRISGGAGDDVIDLSRYGSNSVKVDGVNNLIEVAGATIHYSDVLSFNFSNNVFDGSPHGISFETSTRYSEVDPWIVQGRDLRSYAPEDDNSNGLHSVFLDYTGTRDRNYTLSITATSGLHPDRNDHHWSNAYILFDAVQSDYAKAVIQRTGQNAWHLSEKQPHYTWWKKRAEYNEQIEHGTSYDMDLVVNGRRASLVVDGDTKGSYYFSEDLHDGRIGVGAQFSWSHITLDMAPSNWAPAAQSYDLAMNHNDGSVVTPDLLRAADDPEGDEIHFSSFQASSEYGGTIAQEDGVLRYTPPEGFLGRDSFTYQITDGQTFATGEVRITVQNASLIEVPRGADIALSIDATLSAAATEHEHIEVHLRGIPKGSILSDGERTETATASGKIDISDWNYSDLVLSQAPGQITGYVLEPAARIVTQTDQRPWETREVGVIFY